MKTLTRTLAFLLITATAALGQYTNQGPVNTPAQNSTVFVGAVPGFLTSIQSAVTFACAAGVKRVVAIPSAYAGADSISAVTGGCTNTVLEDLRALPWGCYTWTSSAYSGPGPCFNLTAFAINSFTCSICGNVEAGVTTASPVNFTASYTSTPGSASISDGTNATALSTPFTSGSLAHSYCTVGQGIGSTTFTLTAIGSSTQTSSQAINCAARTFGGVGTAGATGATASGSTAVLAGATGTLSSAGITNQGGYGPYSPSGQKIYVLMQGGSHTFTSGGFAFPMNTPTSITFTNQYGVSVTLYLYESTNLLSATFTLTVAS